MLTGAPARGAEKGQVKPTVRKPILMQFAGTGQEKPSWQPAEGLQLAAAGTKQASGHAAAWMPQSLQVGFLATGPALSASNLQVRKRAAGRLLLSGTLAPHYSYCPAQRPIFFFYHTANPLSLTLSPEPANKRTARQSAAEGLQGPAKRRTSQQSAAAAMLGFLATGLLPGPGNP